MNAKTVNMKTKKDYINIAKSEVCVTFTFRLSALTGIVCQDNDNEQDIYTIHHCNLKLSVLLGVRRRQGV